MASDKQHNEPLLGRLEEGVENTERSMRKKWLEGKKALHGAVTGVEAGLGAGGMAGLAIAVGTGAGFIPAAALIASFMLVGAAIGVDQPVKRLAEGCGMIWSKCKTGVSKLTGKGHTHDAEHELHIDTASPVVPEKRGITFENENFTPPAVSFQQRLAERSGSLQGKGL